MCMLHNFVTGKGKLAQFWLHSQLFYSWSNYIMIYVHVDQHDAAPCSLENIIRSMTTEVDRKATNISNDNCQVQYEIFS